MNLPNKLTVTRILAVPFIIVALYLNTAWSNIAATVLFCIAAFTDFLDGYLARKNKIVTDFGKLLDPVADKLLVLSTLIMLTDCKLMIAWPVILILARELSVDGLRLIAASKGSVIAAGKLGKIKTVSQIVLILWLMITRIPVADHVISIILLSWVCIITFWSGVDYFCRNKGLISSK